MVTRSTSTNRSELSVECQQITSLPTDDETIVSVSDGNDFNGRRRGLRNLQMKVITNDNEIIPIIASNASCTGGSGRQCDADSSYPEGQ